MGLARPVASFIAAVGRLVYDGRMSKTAPIAAPDASGTPRTVLLCLEYDVEPLKSGIHDHACRAGWRVLDMRFFGNAVPRGLRPDGVLFRMTDRYAPILRRFLRLGVPVVQINDWIRLEGCCYVIQDRRAIGEAAARHFATRGFRNLAYLHSEGYEQSPYRLISDSFVACTRGLGAKVDLIAVQHPGQVVPWNRFATLAKRFAKEIARLERPLGIFTYNDVMAVRICQFCRDIGLSVPEEVAILGHNNHAHICDIAPTPLSSVDPNFFGQGITAARLLDRLMDGGTPPDEPILIPPTGVVTRQSTDVLALPDVETARALRYMWEHLAEPLSVADIAEASGVSRRKLERHFRAHLGRSVNEELTRKRIERCCELLIATKASVKTIAEQIGYASENHFFKVFREAMGTTPRKYRLAQAAKGREAKNGRLKPQP